VSSNVRRFLVSLHPVLLLVGRRTFGGWHQLKLVTQWDQYPDERPPNTGLFGEVGGGAFGRKCMTMKTALAHERRARA
jgi:hypothetical protein